MEPVPRPGVGGLTHDAARPPALGPSPGAVVAFDAVVLAGGRASRLGGYPKPQLTYRGATLLEHALGAVVGARITAVVGPGPGEPGGPAEPTREAPASSCAALARPSVPAPYGSRMVLYTREEPRYAGPLAALGAGLAAVDSVPGTRADWIAVLAADLPRAPEGVAALLASAAGDPAADGVLGQDEDGRTQPLLAVYRAGPLRAAMAELSGGGGLADRPMRQLVARLDLLPLRLPARVADDVDTWDAARSWGIEGPGSMEAPGATPRQEEAHE